jgi:hypothetical protein
VHVSRILYDAFRICITYIIYGTNLSTEQECRALGRSPAFEWYILFAGKHMIRILTARDQAK